MGIFNRDSCTLAHISGGRGRSTGARGSGHRHDRMTFMIQSAARPRPGRRLGGVGRAQGRPACARLEAGWARGRPSGILYFIYFIALSRSFILFIYFIFRCLCRKMARNAIIIYFIPFQSPRGVYFIYFLHFLDAFAAKWPRTR